MELLSYHDPGSTCVSRQLINTDRRINWRLKNVKFIKIQWILSWFFFCFVKETLTVSSILNISGSFGSPFLCVSVWTSFTLKEVLPTWINFSSRRIVYHFITHQWRFYAGSLSSKSDKPLIQHRVFHSTNEIQYRFCFRRRKFHF